MSNEGYSSKNFFRINGGLNTETNELNMRDGFTVDEANYELLVDGSRRRRKGLALESGGVSKEVGTWRTAEATQTYVWKNVGGDPNKRVVCFRKGENIYFADEGENLSSGWASGNGSLVSMSPFFTSGMTDANTKDAPVTFTHGRGRLIVGGQYVKPFYVEYDADTGEYSSALIQIQVRDFSDIEDGVSMATEPTGTITDDHRYNLRNRGWKEDDMAQYNTDKSKHPAKNSLWYKGFARSYGSNVSEVDGTRAWDSDKLEAEAFGSSSAPKGSLFLEPYDTTYGYGVAGAGTDPIDISTWNYSDGGTYWTITITTAAAHGLVATDEISITGNSMIYYYDFGTGELLDVTTSFDGTYEVLSAPTATTLTIQWDSEPGLFDGWISQFASLGQIDGSDPLVRSSGETHDDGIKSVEFHAGRVFYAGMVNNEWADTIFFSQIADGTEKFGRCYQDADPTDEDINALTPADGGTIVIPGLSSIQDMRSVRNSLVVFTEEGIFEISGGQRGVFTADGYSVRQLSEVGCSSACSITKIENTVIFTGPGGIYLVAPNQFTGLLEVTNVIEDTIQTLWNEVTDAKQRRTQGFYDDALKRLYLLIGPDGSTGHGIDEAFVFDTKAGAWFRYTFDTPTDNVLLSGVALSTVDDPTDGKKAKFFYESDPNGSQNEVSIADLSQTGFDDWDGTNGPLPYLVFGHDNIGDHQTRKQAPVLTVYSKRTETGYTDTGSGFEPINESSTLMSAYWDWTDDSVSNKISAQQEVYRHPRTFVPSASDDVDGYPVVVSRNKVRGRGRALQIRFDGAEDKDSHILGYTTNFKIPRRNNV